MSRETGIPLVATNDVHYIKQEDAEAHDILLCIQTGKNQDDQDRMKFPNDAFYLKSEDEMRRLFPARYLKLSKTAGGLPKDAMWTLISMPFIFLITSLRKVKHSTSIWKRLCHEGLLKRI
jgi:DNA polymerase III alpha subunit